MRTVAPQELASGLGFAEGPIIRSDGEIVFVSISQGRLYRFQSGKASVLAELPGGPNGATEGLDGTIYVAQTGGRWGQNKQPDWSRLSGVQAVGRDGSVRWISTDPIAPNDLCFGPDGLLYVTDPTRYREARDDGRLFRINVQTGETEILCSMSWYPNGIGFGLEDDAVYVAQSGPKRVIVRIPIERGRLGKEEIFARLPEGYSSDGFAFDTQGNLTTASPSHCDEPGMIHTFDRNGKLIDSFNPNRGKKITNVAIDANAKLIATASDEGLLLAIEGWPTPGLPLHPFRKVV